MPAQPQQPDLFGAADAEHTERPDTPRNMPRKVRTYPIPALQSKESRRSQCRGGKRGGTCTAFVWWTEKIRVPLSTNGHGCYPPTLTKSGLGFSHFEDCPDAGGFRAARGEGGERGERGEGGAHDAR